VRNNQSADVAGSALAVGTGDVCGGGAGQWQLDDDVASLAAAAADDDASRDVAEDGVIYESAVYLSSGDGSCSSLGDGGPPPTPGPAISGRIEARVSARETWSFVLKNLDRHAHDATSGERWLDIGAAIDGDRSVEGVVLCEVCLPDGVCMPTTRPFRQEIFCCIPLRSICGNGISVSCQPEPAFTCNDC
jgi:hypothetical protein